MPWSPADIPDLTGRVAVVTGANGGLGLETARELARKAAHVVLAARNPTKTDAAVADIMATVPDASLEVVPLDLGNQAGTKHAAATIVAAHPAIDILVNNAGVMAMPERTTDDGYEFQFGINHLGHWTFTAGLLPALLAAPAARVVTVSSTAKHLGRAVDPDNPHMRGNYGEWKMYGQAKLANWHFAIGLDRQFRAAGLSATSVSAHPGLTHSDLQVHSAAENATFLNKLFEKLAATTGMSTARGAHSQLRAATEPGIEGGSFWGPAFMTNGPAVKKPIFRRWGMDDAIATLWAVSEAETGVKVDVAAPRAS